ncbi:uncharacterized protein DS421_10g301340 [Arachis hypogaea]|nr:uncharacterized protein DS421_10g301340 [Arachis hypogaea]
MNVTNNPDPTKNSPVLTPSLSLPLQMEVRVPYRSSLMMVLRRGSCSRGAADDVLPFGDVPPDLSFEDLECTFPRFSSLEGLGEYRV